MDNPSALIKELNQAYGLALAEQLTAEQLEKLLAEQFNIMIREDFSSLVQFLYRMDISETRLRHLLKAPPTSSKAASEEAGKFNVPLVLLHSHIKNTNRHQVKKRETNSTV